MRSPIRLRGRSRVLVGIMPDASLHGASLPESPMDGEREPLDSVPEEAPSTRSKTSDTVLNSARCKWKIHLESLSSVTAETYTVRILDRPARSTGYHCTAMWLARD